MSTPLLVFQGVSMQYGAPGAAKRQVLDEVSFALPPSTSISLVGPSGSGKSTLLHLAAGILVPSEGTISLSGQNLTDLSETRRTHLRRTHLGLVFQFFHLLPHLTVGENISLPAWVAGTDSRQVEERLDHLLQRVGLADRRDDSVGKLSGGEMQRIAICRALLLKPRLVLADEPTGSLDEKTGRKIMDLLLEMVRDEGGSLLYVTHSQELAGAADQTWQLHDGTLLTGTPA